MATLKVNFGGGKLCVESNGHKYEYIPERDKGVLEVDEADVGKLVELYYESGCRCGLHGNVTRFHYFEKI